MKNLLFLSAAFFNLSILNASEQLNESALKKIILKDEMEIISYSLDKDLAHNSLNIKFYNELEKSLKAKGYELVLGNSNESITENTITYKFNGDINLRINNLSKKISYNQKQVNKQLSESNIIKILKDDVIASEEVRKFCGDENESRVSDETFSCIISNIQLATILSSVNLAISK